MADLRTGDSGVTLVEMLIVLVIIGVGAAVVTLALSAGPAPRAIAQEAGLLESRLNLAAERSLISARHQRLEWDADGYAFETWDGENWIGQRQVHRMDGGILLTDGSGGQSGRVAINPDGLPQRGAVTVLRVGAGAGQRLVRFDGARAAVLP